MTRWFAPPNGGYNTTGPNSSRTNALPTREEIARVMVDDDVYRGRTCYVSDDEWEWYLSNADAVLKLLKERSRP